MKATIEFILPEEQSTYKIHNQCMDMYRVIIDLKETLRSKLKYAKLTNSQRKIYEEINDNFFELMEGYGVATDL